MLPPQPLASLERNTLAYMNVQVRPFTSGSFIADIFDGPWRRYVSDCGGILGCWDREISAWQDVRYSRR